MKAPLALLLNTLFAAFPLAAASALCDDPNVTVTGADAALTAQTCSAVARAIATLGQCGITVPMPVAIEIDDDLPDNCFGLYHCGTRRLEVRSPDALARMIGDDNPFQAVSAEAFFDSVITHELTHLAYDSVPCPFETCPATSEYIAYAMQIDSLPETDRSAFVAQLGDRVVKRDEINFIFMMMAPNKFAQKAWAHYSQQPDPCSYANQIMQGDIIFDFVLF